MTRYDMIIIGGGIVGLATGYQLLRRHPSIRLCVLEKENRPGQHQTGRNSGVIHSGIYYKPGSLKARNCSAGRTELIAFAREHRIPHEICGKVMAAASERELPNLDLMEKRGRENGLEGIRRLNSDEISEIEPHCRGIAGLFVPQTGIIDYSTVCQVLAETIQKRGQIGRCEILTGHTVTGIHREDSTVWIETPRGNFATRHFIACAGLQSDRIARMDGVRTGLRIVPFRGDYYELDPSAHQKVRNLIYPVPDPALPFLGVHFTRMINGDVECGPSAVFSFAREGYRKWDFRLKDTLDSLIFPGTWLLFMKNLRYGMGEYSRAFSKRLFLRALRRLIPDLSGNEIHASRSGIRAQAVDSRGAMVDDFRIETTETGIHVLNAPSPAATAALAIGSHIVDMADRRFQLADNRGEVRNS
jgi:L-2-hydroxyglutarate oxidase